MTLRLLVFLSMAYLLPALAVQRNDAGSTSAAGQFPSIQAKSLDGKQFHLPQDFGGQVNLVIVSFAREQQHIVDSWVPAAREMEAAHLNLRYYEIPAMSRQNFFYRWWFDAALRSNTVDTQLRTRILTAYVNMHTFLASLHIKNEKNVTVLLIDHSGRVLWQTAGLYTAEKQASLDATLTANHI